MVIEVALSAQWSKLNWDKSWESIVDLKNLLPRVGRQYALPIKTNTRVLPIKMEFHNIKNGKAHFLWTPPHSELNGWADTRPSEILNTFVIEGLVENREQDVETIDFVVLGLTRLTDVFDRVDKEKNSPLSIMGSSDGTSRIHWEDAKYNLRSAYVNQYIYLSGTDESGESDLELILSRKDNKLCLHYSAERCEYTDYRAQITMYYLDEADELLIESLLIKAEVIVDNTGDELPEGKVLGAEYQ